MMLCRIVRRIGHFFSAITLIWSRGQADDSALAFLMMVAISAYEGGEVSKGKAGAGSGTNQDGSRNRQSLTESEIERILVKYSPHCIMVNSGIAPAQAAKKFLQVAQKSVPKLRSDTATALLVRDLDCRSCLSLCER